MPPFRPSPTFARYSMTHRHYKSFPIVDGPFRAVLPPMLTLLHRLHGLAHARGFDATGGGQRWERTRPVDGLNTAILAGATAAARRAGWYARNKPWVASAMDSTVGIAVGAGIKPQPPIPTEPCTRAAGAKAVLVRSSRSVRDHPFPIFHTRSDTPVCADVRVSAYADTLSKTSGPERNPIL